MVFGFGIILHSNSNNKHADLLYSLPEKGKTHERTGDQHFTKVAEAFFGHEMRPDNDLSRWPHVFTFDSQNL